jgi:hypothetical protein
MHILNYMLLKEKTGLGVYILYTNSYRVISNQALLSFKDTHYTASEYVPMINECKFCIATGEVERSCYVEAAKYCLEEILNMSDAQRVLVFSTDVARYYEGDKLIVNSDKQIDIFDLSKAKENEGKWEAGSIRNLFRKLLDCYIETVIKAKLCISGQKENQDFEIEMELRPKYIPLGQDFEASGVEFYLEAAVSLGSFDIQNFQGRPWIGYASCSEFLQLYNDAMNRRYGLICSCAFNVESNEHTNYPSYYCFIPSDNHQQIFLIKVISN